MFIAALWQLPKTATSLEVSMNRYWDIYTVEYCMKEALLYDSIYLKV